jgi:hypothetical protein
LLGLLVVLVHVAWQALQLVDMVQLLQVLSMVAQLVLYGVWLLKILVSLVESQWVLVLEQVVQDMVDNDG